MVRGVSRAGMLMCVLLVCVALFVVACSKQTATGNVVKAQVPVRTCSVPGFSCYVEASGPGVVQFNLRNNLGTDIENVAVSLVAKECSATPNSISLGRFPGGAQNSVRFSCAPASDAVTGTVTVSYSTRSDPKSKSAAGTITVNAG